MIIPLLALADVGPADPVLGTPTFSIVHDGDCGPNPFQLLVEWTLSGADDEYFETKVYENGVEQVTIGSENLDYLYTLNGYSRSGDLGDDLHVEVTFRVDVIRKATGEVVQSKSSAEFDDWFHACP